jgi:hypothetical protein
MTARYQAFGRAAHLLRAIDTLMIAAFMVAVTAAWANLSALAAVAAGVFVAALVGSIVILARNLPAAEGSEQR